MATTINSRPGGANVPPFDAVADGRKYVVLRDDFIGGLIGTLDDTNPGLGELGWLATDIVGDADTDVDIVTTAATILGHPGVISFNTGGTSAATSDEGGLTLPGPVVLPTAGTGMIYMSAAIRFPDVADTEFNFGLHDLSLGAGRDTDSVSLEFDPSASTHWVGQAIAGSASVGTVTDAGAVVAKDTWYSVEMAADAGSAYFWVDGELIGSITGTMTALPLYPGFKVATEADAEHSVLIDYCVIRMPVDR